MHLCRISVTRFPVFVLTLFVAAAREGVSISKTADLRVVAESLGASWPMTQFLAR